MTEPPYSGFTRAPHPAARFGALTWSTHSEAKGERSRSAQAFVHARGLLDDGRVADAAGLARPSAIVGRRAQPEPDLEVGGDAPPVQVEPLEMQPDRRDLRSHRL